MTDDAVTQLQKALGVTFNNPDILLEALTHRSYFNEHEDVTQDNERLEFLGDSVIGYLVATSLFQKFPDMSEGDLTVLKSAAVRTDSLASIGHQYAIGDYLRVGRGEERNGTRESVNVICSTWEAIIGAVWIDQGFDAVVEIMREPLESLYDNILQTKSHIDARTYLQELTQAELRLTPRYEVSAESGPDHEKQYEIEVFFWEKPVGRGIGNSKRTAAQAAAADALSRIQREGIPSPND